MSTSLLVYLLFPILDMGAVSYLSFLKEIKPIILRKKRLNKSINIQIMKKYASYLPLKTEGKKTNLKKSRKNTKTH